MMKNKEYYKNIVLNYLENEFTAQFYKETDAYIVFVCRRIDKDLTPDTMIVAVNKSNDKCGASVHSDKNAISACLK